MKKNKNTKKYLIFTLIGVILFIVIAIVLIKIKDTPRIPSSQPTSEDEVLLQNRATTCPYLNADIPNKGEYYSLIAYECSFRESSIKEGEELTVEISSSDIDTGIQEFRNWLSAQGLQESETLRVEYIHKPQ